MTILRVAVAVFLHRAKGHPGNLYTSRWVLQTAFQPTPQAGATIIVYPKKAASSASGMKLADLKKSASSLRNGMI